MGRRPLGKIRINLKINPDLLRRVDAQADRKGMNRSDFVAMAMQAICERMEGQRK